MRNGKAARGFTYLGLLLLLAAVSLAAAAGVKFGALVHRRAAEAQLLEVGSAFSEALHSYAEATPRGQPKEPRTLQDLIRDPRFPTVRRHLRKLFVDPITGNDQWGIVELETGPGIVGVFSLSTARPIKIGNFDLAHEDFTGKRSYRDWIFSVDQARARVLGRASNGKLSSPLDRVGEDQDAARDQPAPATDKEEAPPTRVSPLHL